MTAHSDDPATLRDLLERINDCLDVWNKRADAAEQTWEPTSISLLYECRRALSAPPASAVDVEALVFAVRLAVGGPGHDYSTGLTAAVCNAAENEIRGYFARLAASGEKEKGK